MFDMIPQGWKIVELSEIADGDYGIVDGPFGSNLKVSDYIDDSVNGVPVLTTKNLNGDYSKDSVRYISKEKFDSLKRSAVTPGDIIVAKIGSIGKCGIYPLDQRIALIPANLLKITPKSDVNRKYVFYYIQSAEFQKRIKSIATATAQPAFNVTKFRKLPIPIPSLPEQNCIVARIEELFSELDNGVETLQKTKQQLAVYRQAVLKEAFQKCIDRVPIQSVCRCVTDGDHMPPPKAPSGVPFVMISNVENSKILWDNTAYVSREYFNAIDSKRKPKKGDVLYTVTGSYGIPILVDFKKEFCFQRHIALLRPNDNTLSEFLYYALMEPSVYAQATKGATGTAQKTVGLGVLRRMVIPYTSSVELQERIVSEIEGRLSMCEHISETVDVALHEAEAMRQSILKQAFEGKL